MTIFGADPKQPHYIGGGDLWEEPLRDLAWWERVPWGAISLLFVAISFFFVGLTFWLSAS